MQSCWVRMLATWSPFLNIGMLHRSYAQRRRSMVHETIDLMPAHILFDASTLEQGLQDFYHQLHPVNVRSMLKDSIYKQYSMLTNDAFPNTKLLQQMHLDDLAENSDMVEGFAFSVHDTAAVKCQFYARLEKWIGDLKRPLFQNEVPVVGVRCVGGVGKTTLALALCNDVDIKGYFQTLVFITVSQSANVKEFLETLWDNITGRKRSEFQNLEDAPMQLQQQLLRQSKSTLLILDDDGSRANLEKLLFQVAGYKTLFTTRDSSIIPRNYCIHFYQLPMPGQEDAMFLFCLHGEPCEAWESVNNKVSKGELVSDYYIGGLLRFLDTSIGFVDDVARECFLDLGEFPEDKRICADALLHIWVYVPKLEWLEAFAILLELASRNLLNLTSNPRSTAPISYASELYFSLYDIMRDLDLHLGGQGITFQRNRLLMPRKENILPWKWELLKDRPFDAQIVSIYTGPVDKSNWYKNNFPKTEGHNKRCRCLIFTPSTKECAWRG